MNRTRIKRKQEATISRTSIKKRPGKSSVDNAIGIRMYVCFGHTTFDLSDSDYVNAYPGRLRYLEKFGCEIKKSPKKMRRQRFYTEGEKDALLSSKRV